MQYLRSLLLVAGVSATVHAGITINEFHYDNAATDVGEFVEVVTDPGQRQDVQAGAVVLCLYNGDDGQVYRQINLQGFTFHGTLADGMDYYSQAIAGIQNGSPDGMALTYQGQVVEFLSYEGIFHGTEGPAAGLISLDIGAAEGASTPVGSSLQRIHFGTQWVLTEGSDTRGEINSFHTVPAPGALGLAMAGLLGFRRVRRRRR